MRISAAVDLCARRSCFGCRAPGELLCDACHTALRSPDRNDPIRAVDQLFVPWHYEGAARDLVLALKLRSQRGAAAPLTDALARLVQMRGTTAEAVTWVPARGSDIRRRGFDHAEVIARGLADRIGLPVVAMLRRAAPSPDQTTLTAAQRRSGLEGIFRALDPPDRVLLVDDLVTTGATASSCAHALRMTGSYLVDLAAPCRA